MPKALRAAGHGLILLGILICAAGCPHNTKKPIGYYGPTLSMADLVARVNENNQAIPSLFARQEIQAACGRGWRS